jgi:hypothetical protein
MKHKKAEVKYEITPELIKNLFDKAKKAPLAEKNKILRQCEFFCKHVGEYLVKDVDEE